MPTNLHRPAALIIPLFFSLSFFASKTNGEDLTCLNSEVGGTHAKINWYDSLKQEAIATLAKRRERIEQLKTPEQIQS